LALHVATPIGMVTNVPSLHRAVAPAGGCSDPTDAAVVPATPSCTAGRGGGGGAFGAAIASDRWAFAATGRAESGGTLTRCIGAMGAESADVARRRVRDGATADGGGLTGFGLVRVGCVFCGASGGPACAPSAAGAAAGAAASAAASAANSAAPRTYGRV
jgi:hypothetical protein